MEGQPGVDSEKPSGDNPPITRPGNDDSNGTRHCTGMNSVVEALVQEVTRLRHELQQVQIRQQAAPAVAAPPQVQPPSYMPSGVATHPSPDPFKVPLPEIGGKPWCGPTQALPYAYFRDQVWSQIQCFNLLNEQGVYYLLRCVGGSLLTELRKEMLNGATTVEKLFDFLDKKHSAQWRNESAEFRWDGPLLNQRDGEDPEAYANRVRQESLVLSAALGRPLTDYDLRSRFRKGLKSRLRQVLHQFIGPRVCPFDELVDIAAFYWTTDESLKDLSASKPSRPPANDGICIHYQKHGSCKRGHLCRYKHEETRQVTGYSQEPGRIGEKSLSDQKSRDRQQAGLCWEFIENGSCTRERCMFKHLLWIAFYLKSSLYRPR
ncbi:hypothetical protein FOL46_000135, partial [Perkinsus olseni]